MTLSTQGKYEMWQVTAGQALTNLVPGTGHLYKAIRNKTGKFADNGREACGILQYGADNGGYASIGYIGIQKAIAGIAITSADTLLTVSTSGYFTIAASGDWIVGRNLTAATSGYPFTGMFNFINPSYYNPTENSSGT